MPSRKSAIARFAVSRATVRALAPIGSGSKLAMRALRREKCWFAFLPMMRIAELIELKDQERLAEVVTGSDVRAIIGGHFHFTSHSTFAGIPVSVASATCYTSELAPDQRLLSAVDGHQAFTMLHVYADRIVHSVVPADDSTEISGYGLDMAAPFEALSPQERFEIVSRKDSPLYANE